MPMSATVLAAAMLAKVDAIPPPDGGSVDQAYRLSLMKAIAEAVVEHIAAFAIVSGPVVVTSVSLVTPGVGVSGPGVGTLAAGTII